jgi:hypothetical protein
MGGWSEQFLTLKPDNGYTPDFMNQTNSFILAYLKVEKCLGNRALNAGLMNSILIP